MEKEYHPVHGFPWRLHSRGGLEEGLSWDQSVAEELAQMKGIGRLTADHWKVIDFVRDYYRMHGSGPTTHKIYKATGFRLPRLLELFPGGEPISWNTSFIAGLPWPVNADGIEESGFHSGADQSSASHSESRFPVPSCGSAEMRTGSKPIMPGSRWKELLGFAGQHGSMRKIAWAAVLVVAVISAGVIWKNPLQRKDMPNFVPMTRVEAQIKPGIVEIPLDVVKKKGLVSFEYKGKYGDLPLLAYFTPSKKIMTLVGISDPCNSKSFHLEGNAIVCNICLTRWDLESLNGISGECLTKSLQLVRHFVDKGKVIITEMDIRNLAPVSARG